MFLIIILVLTSLTFAVRTAAGENTWRQPPEIELNDRPTESPTGLAPDDTILFTANQEWLSRIYLLGPEGNVYTHYEYEFYRFVDFEIVDGEVYVAEAFAPRAYKVDLATGDLEVFIDDWSLYYFYDIAFDGEYFYVDEWDLNRYDIEGDKDGTAAFDEFVAGSAWDGRYLWTMDDSGHAKCWDISGWPTLTEIVENTFPPPSPQCRGFWFDGEYFWTAESIDGALGYIYRFDHRGRVIAQWLAPAFSGWGAAAILHDTFVCGDANGDEIINILDITFLIDYLYMGGPPPDPLTAVDVNSDGTVNILDITCLIAYLYDGGPEPNCPQD